jgi:hypothetical protein
MSDPLYFNVALMMPFDGANGATAFTDYSYWAKTFTNTGGVAITTSDSVYGGACATFSGSNHLTVVGEAKTGTKVSFGTLDWTIMFRMKSSASSGAWNGVVSSLRSTGTVSGDWTLTNRGAAGSNRLEFNFYNGTAFNDQAGNTIAFNGINDGAWHHVAMVRSGTNLYLFVDGVLKASGTCAANFTFSPLELIGYNSHDLTHYTGLLDELVVYVGVGLYTANFTVPGQLDTSPAATTLLVPTPGAPRSLAAAVPNPFLAFPNVGANSLRDWNYGGKGRVSGTVKIKGTPDAPVHRRVWLIRDRDGACIREAWSDATTGAYTFDYIDESLTYTVLAYDYQHNFRAVVADNLIPTVIQ